MKDSKHSRGPHFVGQQLAYLGSQEYTQGKQTSDFIAPKQAGSNSGQNNMGALLSINNSLNMEKYSQMQHQQPPRKKFVHGGSGTGTGGSEQRQMNLAEMVRTSNIVKQPQQHLRKDALQSLSQPQQQSEYIKGTQVSKDFQLIAEPLIPRGISNQQQQLQHNNSQNNNLKSQWTSSQTSNTAVSSTLDKQSIDANTQQYSQNSSRKNLDGQYSSAASKGGASNYSEMQQIQQNLMQNQAIQQLIMQQNSQQYTSNRSAAAKAGQMQIFSHDKYNHLSSTNSTQNTKFQSPGKIQSGKLIAHHQSASQQIENIVDLQQMKIRTNGEKNQNQKYTEYLNRFSTSQSIDQSLVHQPKSKEFKSHMLEDDNSSKFNYLQETSSLPDSTQFDGSQPNFSIQGSNNFTSKRSPLVQKENRVDKLGVSGEQMHLEEKTFLKKIGTLVSNSVEASGQSSHRIGGSSRKRQELSINARGINRGYKAGLDQNLATQPKTRYDYVFIRIPDEQFDKEFSNKIIFSRDPSDQSPLGFSLKNKRVTNMAMNSPKRDDLIQPQYQTPQLQLSKHQTSIRSSQEYSKENKQLLSPMSKNQLGAPVMEDLISIQNLQPEKCSSFVFQQPQIKPSGTCSIISTNHTHIKVISHFGTTNQLSELSQEQLCYQQIQLNDCVQDVMAKVQEKGRVVKTTQKKKYILNALSLPHVRIASIYVIVIDNSVINDIELRNTLMTDQSTTSSINFNSTLTKLNNGRGGLKQVFKKDSQAMIKNQDQINAKNIRLRNNSTINSKGYESEGEVKSTNSTTTSSTLQHFIPTRNFDQNVGSNTTKNSSRSLSQKGTQPRKILQKGQQIPIDDQAQYTIQKDGLSKKYPPTKIKIVSPFDYNQHESHKINVCLNNYNNFIQICFKQKGKINVPAVIKLGKVCGLSISSNMFTDGIIKSREQANLIKEKLTACLCKVINECNQPENMPENQAVQDAITPLIQPVHQYKCFVGKGNNSILIRTLFKTRFWWLLHDKEEIEKVNFMWTQLRKNPIMDTFPCKFEDKKSGLRHGGQQTVMQTPGKIKTKKKMISMQSSSLSIDSSGGATGSNDKKESKIDQVVTLQQNQISQALQQLNVKLYNKLEDNFHLSNKKAMFLNIRVYYEAMGKDVFNAVPMTFHVKEGLEDPEFQRFKTYYYKEEDEIKRQKQMKGQAAQEQTDDVIQTTPLSTRKNIWIVKPGENTNRGQGITVLKDFDEIKAIIQESTANKKRTCIVQKYIHNPLLINKRKFDIRLYAFMSSVNGNIKGYFYQDGYLRTSCREFTLANLSNRMIHLTNDAVQKHAEDYGKFEAGNKLSYTDFQNYLDKNYTDLSICFERDLLPQMKKLVTDMFRSVYGKIDPKKRINTFEIYGYDFMFDDEFKVFLIEVNTNPCLELGCPLLARLIPTMVENSLRLVVDPLFPAPENWSQKKCVVNEICPENKFELIFDDKVDGPYLTELMKEKNNIIIEIDEEELSDNDLDEKEDGDN